MLKEERQQLILNALYQEGKVLVNDLSQQYAISRDTVRRDLTELEDQGVLRRVFGGAIPTRMPAAAIDIRRNVDRPQKQTVAQKAVSLIKPNALIAIDGGTTNLMLAQAIPMGFAVRVVTNSFPVAAELRLRPQAEVIFLGGNYDKGSQTTVGEAAIQQLERYHFDQCFLGVHAIDAVMGVSVPYPFEKEAAIKKELVRRSDEVIAMCSNSKLDKHTNYIICALESLDIILCDEPVSQAMASRYQGKIR